jgi:hypothetical protein
MTALEEIKKALKALEQLVALVAEDTGALVMPDPDEDSVGYTLEGELEMTFGHVRRAHAAISSLEAALSAAEPVHTVDWDNPNDPVVKLFVGFDVETYVNEYELRGDEGDYSPNEKEKTLMVDAIYGVVSNLHEAVRKLSSSSPTPPQPAPSVAVKALADAYQKYLDAVSLYNERHAIMKTKPLGTMRVDEEYKAIDETRRAFDKLAVEVATSALSAQAQDAPLRVGRFGHHPEPAIDFCIEVEALEGHLFDARHGIGKPGHEPRRVDDDFRRRVSEAMDFIVGGDQIAIAAKATLRSISAQVQDVAEVSPVDYMRRHDAAIAAYEANTPNDYRYSALALRKAVDAAFAVAAAPAKQEGGHD